MPLVSAVQTAAGRQQRAADTKKRIQRERAEDNPAQVDRQDTEVMLCVIFKTRDERENMAERLGYDRDERYVDGARLAGRLADAAGRSVTAPNGSVVPASNPKPPKPGKPARPS